MPARSALRRRLCRKLERVITKKIFIAGLLIISLVPLALTTARTSRKSHLDWAKILVKELRPENTSYQHKNGYVRWKGQNGADDYESHTDCSGFINAILEQAYSLTADDFEQWLGKRRPLAITYHTAIINQRGFKRIEVIREVKPGDLIAIKYPDGSDNTGHNMIVAQTPQERKASKPEVEGTMQWEVDVIDSSESGHGKTDTRRKDDGTFGAGVGEGVFRLYTDGKGQIVGYTWSTFANSDYYDQTERQLVIGRLDLPTKGLKQ